MIVDGNRRTTSRLDCLHTAGVETTIRYYARTTSQPEKTPYPCRGGRDNCGRNVHRRGASGWQGQRPCLELLPVLAPSFRFLPGGPRGPIHHSNGPPAIRLRSAP